jgi:DNA-binding NarL/FixJ family response regulator
MRTVRLPPTPRQREVLRLVADGCGNKEIASRLGITEAGVKKHLESLFRRYEVNGRLALVLAAIDNDDITRPTRRPTKKAG